MVKTKNIFGRIGGIRLTKPARVLVFESTGFSLYGVVAGRGLSSSFEASPPAMSMAPEPEEAIGEVLQQLRARTKKRLPKTAVLVTPSAAGNLLSLPVDPQSPRPKVQMKEMVRWEIEELFVRHSDLWSLGALLVGRGYLSPERRMELESAAGVFRPGADLYGGEAGKQQIDECLSIQERLLYTDDDLVAGWAPQVQKDESGPFTWYGAGIGAGIRDLWVRAFKKHRLFCSFIYPQIGAALPLIDTAREDGWLFIDVRQEQFGLFQGGGGRIESISVQPCLFGVLEPDVAVEAVKRRMHPGIRDVYYSAPPALAASLSASLGPVCAEMGIRLSPVVQEDDADGTCPLPVLASLRGAARHALNPKASEIPRIEARDPKPPVWKNRELWPWAALLLLVFGLAGYDTYMRVRTGENEWQLDRLDIEYGRKLKIINEARSVNIEAARLAAELAAKEKELKEAERLRDLLNDVIRYRQKLVPGILEAISRAATDEVVLDMIEEKSDRSGFYLEGWALRDTEGQRFGKRLNETLARWHYKMEDLQLERGAGRVGLNGFTFKARLVKTEPEKEQGAQ